MKHYKSIIFDYGNTLIEFSKSQLRINDQAFHAALAERFGPIDFERFHAIRMRDRRAPFEGSPPQFREGTMNAVVVETVRELYGQTIDDDLTNDLAECRRAAFVESVVAPDYLHEFLTHLGTTHRLGLLSNYICGDAIRRSLENLGLSRYFDAVVVSADVGYVKPHAVPFNAILSAMRVYPGETLFVGDNWLADVQGAKRAGLDVCLTRQFLHYEVFEPQPGDHEPDYTIAHLLELVPVLESR